MQVNKLIYRIVHKSANIRNKKKSVNYIKLYVNIYTAQKIKET